MDLGHFIWHMRATKIYTHKAFCAHAAVLTGSQWTNCKTRTSHLVHPSIFFALIIDLQWRKFYDFRYQLKPFPVGVRTCVISVCMIEHGGVWESACACVSVMALPCARGPCMGLKEVGYERNCQACATVGKPPPLPPLLPSVFR